MADEPTGPDPSATPGRPLGTDVAGGPPEAAEGQAGSGAPASVVGLAEYQNEVYLRGLGGERLTYPVSWRELEAAAYAAMSPEAAGYVAGGAGGEETMRANREAFDRWRILPRMLRGVTERALATTVLGTRMPGPVLLGPVGVQSIVHPQAETATARAAASLGVPFVLSTVSSVSLEDVAEVAGDAPRWFQLYWPRSRELAASFVRRAEAAGFSVLVVTADAWMLGWRPRDLQRAFLPFLVGQGLATYRSDPAFQAMLADQEETSASLLWTQQFSNPALTWDDLRWLREQTRMPVVVKGICAADDARLALDAGADGVIVSNHGGRQVDGAVAALDALPAVAEAVAGRVPVLFDSGVRTGADAVKAIALGAAAVLLARPYLWGLALGGEDGVRQVVRMFLSEFDNTLALAGYRRPTDLTPDALLPRP